MAGLRSGYVVADDGSLENVTNVKAKTQQGRLKAALRENLKRRKAQARGRQESDQKGREEADPEGASEDQGSGATRSGPNNRCRED